MIIKINGDINIRLLLKKICCTNLSYILYYTINHIDFVRKMEKKMKLSNFIMDPIKEDMGNTKQGLDINKLLKCGEGLEKADAKVFGENCIHSDKKYLMWGFRAKNSGFTNNIDDYLEKSENSKDINLTYAQVTKTPRGYYFIALSAMEYEELRNSSNTKNVTLKDDNYRSPKGKDEYYTEEEMYQALAGLLRGDNL